MFAPLSNLCATQPILLLFDEYENLPIYQQRVINTWLKHSEAPLIFNLAMKRNAFVTRQTLGDEYISDIHDFRTHDLEAYLAEHFEIFAAEILFLQLSIAQLVDTPVAEGLLRDPKRLAERRSQNTQSKFVLPLNSYFRM